MDFKDLNHRRFGHGDGLGELGSLLKPAELVHGHDEVGARCRLDMVSINLTLGSG